MVGHFTTAYQTLFAQERAASNPQAWSLEMSAPADGDHVDGQAGTAVVLSGSAMPLA